MNRNRYFPEVVRDTGVSERTIKFWMREYALAVGKEGRNTTFPPAVVAEIELIRDLVATQLVTSRLIAVILKTRRGQDPTADEQAALTRLAELWLTAAPVAGTARPAAAPRAARMAAPARPSSPDGIL